MKKHLAVLGLLCVVLGTRAVFQGMAIRADIFKIVQFIIRRVSVHMMSMENFWMFIVPAFAANFRNSSSDQFRLSTRRNSPATYSLTALRAISESAHYHSANGAFSFTYDANRRNFLGKKKFQLATIRAKRVFFGITQSSDKFSFAKLTCVAGGFSRWAGVRQNPSMIHTPSCGALG